MRPENVQGQEREVNKGPVTGMAAQDQVNNWKEPEQEALADCHQA